MAVLTVQAMTRTGIVPSYAAADVAGDSVPISGKEFLHIKNASVSPITVTIASNQDSNFGTDEDVAAVVAATDELMLGPFRKARFADGNGNMALTYSDVTTLTLAVLRNPDGDSDADTKS